MRKLFIKIKYFIQYISNLKLQVEFAVKNVEKQATIFDETSAVFGNKLDNIKLHGEHRFNECTFAQLSARKM